MRAAQISASVLRKYDGAGVHAAAALLNLSCTGASKPRLSTSCCRAQRACKRRKKAPRGCQTLSQRCTLRLWQFETSVRGSRTLSALCQRPCSAARLNTLGMQTATRTKAASLASAVSLRQMSCRSRSAACSTSACHTSEAELAAAQSRPALQIFSRGMCMPQGRLLHA